METISQGIWPNVNPIFVGLLSIQYLFHVYARSQIYLFFTHDTYEVKVFCYGDNIYLLYIIYIFSLCHISMCICVFVCLFLSMCMYTCDFQYLTLLWCCDGRIVCVLIKSNLSFSNFYDFFLSIFSDESLPGLWEPTTSVMAAIHVCFQGLIFKRCFLLIFS